MSLRTIGIRLRMETGAYKRDAAEAAGATDNLGKKITGTATKSKADLDQIAMGMGLVGAALLGVAGVAVAAAATFDKQMSEVKAVTGATADSMAELRQAAIDAGQATVFSAGEAAKAEAELAKAGISTADILGGALRGALDLAAAGSLDLGEAATIAASAMNTFSLSGEDVSHIADVLAAAANKSAADVHDLGLGLQQVGLVANQVGFTLEETVGLLAAFADRGLRGSDGATSLKTALQRLAAPTAKAAELMEELGISMYDAEGQMVGAVDIAGQLERAFADLTPAQRNAALQTLFGSDAIRAANVLYAEGAAGIQEYIDAVNDQGAASDMAATKLDNLAGDLEQLKGSLETLAIGAGSGAGGGLRPLVQMATNLVNALGNIPAPVQTAGVALTGLAGAALLAGAGWLKLQQVVGPALESLAKTGPVGTRAASALGTVGAVIGKVTLALAALQVASAAFGDKPLNVRVDAMSDSLAEFGRTGNKAGEAARVLGKDFDNFAYSVQALNTGFWADLGNGIEGTFEGLTGLGNVMDESLLHAREQLAAIDAGLANLVATGRPAQAAKAFNDLAVEAAKHNVSVSELTAGLPQYAAAMDNAAKKTAEGANAATSASSATRDLAGAMGEATFKADALTTEWEELNGATMSADEALLAAKKSVDDVAAAFEANGKKISGNSVAALENRIAMGKAGEAATLAAQKYLDLTGDVDGAIKIMNDQRQASIDAAVANGGNRKSVEELADALFDLPAAKKTQITVAGASAGKSMVDALKRSIDSLYSKTVTMTTQLRTVQTGPVASVNRWGGVYQPAADGLLSGAATYAPAAPGRYMIAEPSTGGEAFVPKRGDYGRSMSILSAAAGWYGADVVPRNGWYGGGGGGGATEVIVRPAPGMDRTLMGAIVNGLRFEVKGPGRGDVQGFLGPTARRP